MTRKFASFPQAYLDVGQVQYASAYAPTGPVPGTGATAEITDGFIGYAMPLGKLMVGPGVTDPILWTRGSLYEAGYLPGLPDRGANAQELSWGATSTRFWDAPRAWGNPGFLPRLPNTVILSVFDDGTISAGVASAWASYFAPKNISVAIVFPNGGRGDPGTPPYIQSAPWVGLPVAQATFSGFTLGDGTLCCVPQITPMPTIRYRGGKVFVATSSTFGTGLVGYGASATKSTAGRPPDGPGGTATFTDGGDPPNAGGYIQVCVYNGRISNELAIMPGVMSKFEDYAGRFYWSEDTSGSTPGTLVPDYASSFYPGTFTGAAGQRTFINNYGAILATVFNGPYFKAKQLPNNPTQANLWSAIFADIQSFFGPVP